jgi:hypothetical protein
VAISCGFADELFGFVHAINSCAFRATASEELREVRTKYFDSKILQNRPFGDLGIDKRVNIEIDLKMRLNDYSIQRLPILFLLDFNNFICCVSVHSLCVAHRKVEKADSCSPVHTLLSFRYFIAPVSTFLSHLEVGCVVE